MNEYEFLLYMLLYHVMTSFVFFHWFRLVVALVCVFMFSRICLLIFPISDFNGLMYFGVLWKLSLWSFSVTNACFCAAMSILSSSSSCAILGHLGMVVLLF